MAERKWRILLVDDDASMLKVYGKWFELAGYDVLKASSGAEALAKVAEQPPDLIVLDVEMPGLNGYEVCSKLKENRAMSEIPVVLFTAKGEPQEMPGFPNVYVGKSCQAKPLLEQVKAILTSRPT